MEVKIGHGDGSTRWITLQFECEYCGAPLKIKVRNEEKDLVRYILFINALELRAVI